MKEKVKVKLSWETIDEIIRVELSSMYEIFLRDYAANKNGEDYLAVFHADRNEDRKEIKKMIKSLRRVINYYSKPEDRIK